MNKFNKILTPIVALGLLGGAVGLNSCGNNIETTQIEDKCAVKLSSASLSLCLGDGAKLGANISGGSITDKVTYKSLDSSIATVSENGFVFARGEGTTEIRAIYGTAIDRCVVTVSLNDNVPSIEFKNIVDRAITIDKSTSFTLEPVINFNNAFYDFEPIYEISDETIAKMEGDTFVPLQNGVAYLTVSASSFGNRAISTTLEITISDNVVIYMKDEKGIEKNDVYLYSCGHYEEESFATTFTPGGFGVIINGSEVSSPDLDIDIDDESGVVTFDSSTYKVTSNSKIGMAQYVVTYTNEELNTFVKTFDIYNNKSVFTYKGEALETDIYGAALPTDVLFKDFSSKTIVKATSLDGKTEYKVEGGKVLGLPVLRDDLSGEVLSSDYVVYNDIVGFKVKIKTYTKVLSKIEDLAYFNMTTLSDKFDGYYVVSNDINGYAGETYYELPAHARTMSNKYDAYRGSGLVGTFDGRGHTISGFSVAEGGIFGNMGQGATLKNIKFTNIDFRTNAGDDSTLLTCYMNGSSLDNVCIENALIKAGYNASLTAANIMSNCSFRNCYFALQISSTSLIKSANYGVLGSMCGEKETLKSGFVSTYSNVVINSNIPLVRSATNTVKWVGDTKIVDPFIADVAGHPFEIPEGFSEYLIASDITRYYTNEEMSSSGNTFSKFSSDYWHVEGGMLVWGKK